MRKKIGVLSLFLINFLSFGKINDELGLLKNEEKVILEKKIDEISQKRGITIYVNSFSGEEGFVAEKAERLVILNLIKPNDKSFKVELKLTKDMELDDTQNNVDNILISAEDLLKEKKILEYSDTILTGVDEILENIRIEEPIVAEEEIIEEKKNNFFIGMGIAFFVIFAIIIRVLMLKYKKSFKEEIDIISRKKY